jgi:hypothetical protein
MAVVRRYFTTTLFIELLLPNMGNPRTLDSV